MSDGHELETLPPEEPIANPGLPEHLPRPTDVDPAAEKRADRKRHVAAPGSRRWVPPTFIVDCGAWLAQKEKALMCHRSQLHDPTSHARSIRCARQKVK